MFNYEAIDKTPTVFQIKAIITYMEESSQKFNFNKMLSFTRPKQNIIILDLNDAHSGINYEVIFDEEGSINSFKEFGIWMS